ncbi:MAG: rRNA maturation RNase YbeY [Bacteroidales bacterium]|nr:rRNA maturation RNase YbeY [Deltaproteobacteria bacterium]MBL7137745.1 rRNA maturation RNase YbeY [Bacteroidales bacterium]
MNEKKIQFFTEDINDQIRERRYLRRGIEQLVRKKKFQLGSLNIIFCSDRFLRKFNKTYLHHDYYTDVIAFDFSGEERILTGEIYISLERVRANAKEYKVTLQNEIARVIIHGILHLMGMEDVTEKLKQKMREEEDKYIQLFINS